jgi:hypothetical protein
MLIYVVLLFFAAFGIMGGLFFHMLTDLLIAYLCILVAERCFFAGSAIELLKATSRLI